MGLVLLLRGYRNRATLAKGCRSIDGGGDSAAVYPLVKTKSFDFAIT
jgi:hypothetical protein